MTAVQRPKFRYIPTFDGMRGFWVVMGPLLYHARPQSIPGGPAIVPGGQGSRQQMENPVLLEWLASVAPRCSWVTSVCTGAAILCKAGLVGRREITTHWAYVATLRELAPEATVRDDARYVRDGRLVTAAGVSAGIDMALWLVGQILGEDHARQTQRFMQYDPQPPYS